MLWCAGTIFLQSSNPSWCEYLNFVSPASFVTTFILGLFSGSATLSVYTTVFSLLEHYYVQMIVGADRKLECDLADLAKCASSIGGGGGSGGAITMLSGGESRAGGGILDAMSMGAGVDDGETMIAFRRSFGRVSSVDEEMSKGPASSDQTSSLFVEKVGGLVGRLSGSRGSSISTTGTSGKVRSSSRAGDHVQEKRPTSVTVEISKNPPSSEGIYLQILEDEGGFSPQNSTILAPSETKSPEQLRRLSGSSLDTTTMQPVKSSKAWFFASPPAQRGERLSTTDLEEVCAADGRVERHHHRREEDHFPIDCATGGGPTSATGGGPTNAAGAGEKCDGSPTAARRCSSPPWRRVHRTAGDSTCTGPSPLSSRNSVVEDGSSEPLDVLDHRLEELDRPQLEVVEADIRGGRGGGGAPSCTSSPAEQNVMDEDFEQATSPPIRDLLLLKTEERVRLEGQFNRILTEFNANRHKARNAMWGSLILIQVAAAVLLNRGFLDKQFPSVSEWLLVSVRFLSSGIQWVGVWIVYGLVREFRAKYRPLLGAYALRYR